MRISSHKTQGYFRHFAVTRTDKLLEQDVIQPETTKWAIFIVFVQKRYSALPFYVNHPRLYAVNIRYFRPLPCMDEQINLLEKQAIFLMHAGTFSYCQLKNIAKNPESTTFASLYDLFKFIGMSLRVWSDRGTFWRATHDIPLSMKWK